MGNLLIVSFLFINSGICEDGSDKGDYWNYDMNPLQYVSRSEHHFYYRISDLIGDCPISESDESTDGNKISNLGDNIKYEPDINMKNIRDKMKGNDKDNKDRYQDAINNKPDIKWPKIGVDDVDGPKRRILGFKQNGVDRSDDYCEYGTIFICPDVSTKDAIQSIKRNVRFSVDETCFKYRIVTGKEDNDQGAGIELFKKRDCSMDSDDDDNSELVIEMRRPVNNAMNAEYCVEFVDGKRACYGRFIVPDICNEISRIDDNDDQVLSNQQDTETNEQEVSTNEDSKDNKDSQGGLFNGDIKNKVKEHMKNTNNDDNPKQQEVPPSNVNDYDSTSTSNSTSSWVIGIVSFISISFILLTIFYCVCKNGGVLKKKFNGNKLNDANDITSTLTADEESVYNDEATEDDDLYIDQSEPLQSL